MMVYICGRCHESPAQTQTNSNTNNNVTVYGGEFAMFKKWRRTGSAADRRPCSPKFFKHGEHSAINWHHGEKWREHTFFNKLWLYMVVCVVVVLSQVSKQPCTLTPKILNNTCTHVCIPQKKYNASKY